MDTSAMVEFKLDAEGKLAIDGGTVLEFDDKLPTHRALDVVREMEGDIRAKVEGKYTDADRYRATRAMFILDQKESPLADRLSDRVQELIGDRDEPATEAEFDRNMDCLVVALNELVAELTAKEPEQAAEAGLIVVPEPRKIKLLPETTITDTIG